MKQLVFLGLCITLLLGLVGTASAQGAVPNVQGLQPFTAETRYLSLPGFLRWQYYQETASWVTWGEAVAMVREQGVAVAATPTTTTPTTVTPVAVTPAAK